MLETIKQTIRHPVQFLVRTNLDRSPFYMIPAFWIGQVGFATIDWVSQLDPSVTVYSLFLRTFAQLFVALVISVAFHLFRAMMVQGTNWKRIFTFQTYMTVPSLCATLFSDILVSLSPIDYENYIRVPINLLLIGFVLYSFYKTFRPSFMAYVGAMATTFGIILSMSLLGGVSYIAMKAFSPGAEVIEQTSLSESSSSAEAEEEQNHANWLEQEAAQIESEASVQEGYE